MCCCAHLTILAVRTCKMYLTQGFLVVPVWPCDVNPSLPESCVPNPPTMLLERSDAVLDLSDPNIVLGPCKRRATKRLLENNDPLAYKKSKAVSSASADKDNHTSLLSLMLPLTHPTPTVQDPWQTIKCTKRSDDRASDGAQEIMVDSSEESNSADNGTGSDKGALRDWTRVSYMSWSPIFGRLLVLPLQKLQKQYLCHLVHLFLTQWKIVHISHLWCGLCGLCSLLPLWFKVASPKHTITNISAPLSESLIYVSSLRSVMRRSMKLSWESVNGW